MATTFDSAAAGGTVATTDTVLTIPITIAATANRALFVGVSRRATPEIASVTYNSVAMTLVDSLNIVWTSSDLDVYKLVGDANIAGGTHDVVVTVASDPGYLFSACAVCFNGADQTDPVRASNFHYYEGVADPATSAVDSAAGDLVVDWFSWANYTNPTPDGSQTARANANVGSSGYSIICSTKPGAASVSMAWTLGVTNYDGTAIISVKAAAGAGGTPGSIVFTITL